MSARRPQHRDPADVTVGRVHFWPGAAPFFRTPGGRLPCRVSVRSGAAAGTADVGRVTCRRCRRYLDVVWGGAQLPEAPWSRALLEGAGLVVAGSPPPAEVPTPYRNPNLPEYHRDAPSPLAAMVETVRARAEALRIRGEGLAAAELRSVAARLDDLAHGGRP